MESKKPKFNLPSPPADFIGKLMLFVQAIGFIGVFAALFYSVCLLTDSILLRIVLFIVDYCISSLVLYCLIKPGCERLAERFRNRHR